MQKILTAAELSTLLMVCAAPDQKVLFGQYGPFSFADQEAVTNLVEKSYLERVVNGVVIVGARITLAGAEAVNAALEAANSPVR